MPYPASKILRLFEVARVLVRLDHVPSLIVNTNHGIMCPAEMLRVSDCICGGIQPVVPQATEWQRIGDEIDAALVPKIFFAQSDFLKVFRIRRCHHGRISCHPAIKNDSSAICVRE
jgi:hypothetical protein